MRIEHSVLGRDRIPNLSSGVPKFLTIPSKSFWIINCSIIEFNPEGLSYPRGFYKIERKNVRSDNGYAGGY